MTDINQVGNDAHRARLWKERAEKAEARVAGLENVILSAQIAFDEGGSVLDVGIILHGAGVGPAPSVGEQPAFRCRNCVNGPCEERCIAPEPIKVTVLDLAENADARPETVLPSAEERADALIDYMHRLDVLPGGTYEPAFRQMLIAELKRPMVTGGETKS